MQILVKVLVLLKVLVLVIVLAPVPKPGTPTCTCTFTFTCPPTPHSDQLPVHADPHAPRIDACGFVIGGEPRPRVSRRARRARREAVGGVRVVGPKRDDAGAVQP